MDKVIYECGGLNIDPANRRLSRGSTDIALEPKAFSVLLMLLGRADDLVTRNELLDAVWGHRYITPATLNRVMVLLRRALEDDADHPRLIHTVHGVGYRFVGAVARVTQAREEVRAHFGPPPVAQLPAKLEPLVGRQSELDQLCTILAQYRAVTIVGPGGMGKTQCALEIGRLCGTLFADGVWFFDLSPFDRAQSWLIALAAALSVPTAGTQQLLPRIATALAGRQALLVIDNCDRLAAEIGTHVFALLRGCHELKVLATSQQRLDFVGEHLMWLPPLALPAPGQDVQRAPLDEIASTPAIALLLARAAAVQPAIALSRNNVADVVDICRQLDGMPLALELAAAQFAMLSPAAVRERLQHRFSLLSSDTAGRESRHQTLRALVDWSYGLLSAQQQRLLCWLGVFLQGWTIDAAEHFGSALGMRSDRVLELHSGLILKSLVVVDPTLAPPRYRLLETVREFALELLRASGEEANARSAHLQYFVHLAERSHREILNSQTDEWLDRLRHENTNIDGALRWARSGGSDTQAGLRLVGSLMLYGKAQNLTLMAEWIDRALDGVVAQPSPTYLRALLCSGVFKLYFQDPAIEPQLTEVVTLATQLGDRWAQGCARAFLAMWNANLGRLDQAREDAGVAARLAEGDAVAEADDWLRSLTGLATAWIAIRSDDLYEAVDTLAPLRRVSFDLHQHMMVDIYLALAHYGLGNWQQAARFWADTFDQSLRARNLRTHAGAIEGAAYLARATTRPEICARLLGKAADIRERTHAPLFSFWIAHHDKAMSLARDSLGSATFDGLYAAGALARDELVVEEARALLRQVTESQDSPRRSKSR